MCSVQPEVLYSQKGGSGTVVEGLETFDATVELAYVEIPILAKFNFGTAGVRPFVFTGPVPAFNIDATLTAEAGGEEIEEDLDDDVKGSDFGWVFGGGVNVGALSIDARYTLGLSSVTEDDETEVKNGVFSILVGFGWSR